MNNSLRIGIVAGLIAGFFSAIVMIILNFSGLWEALSVAPHYIPVDTQISVSYELIQGTTWGIIWGVFYAFFYDYIPGERIKKGVIYGLMVYTIAILRSAQVLSSYGAFSWAVTWAFTSFFSIAITYGLVLGYLYKPMK
ncbi:MAG: hypothetical protein NWF08_07850 [Candidatus Bathyarchaeota archaeon]|nr:hypothetical protein [Candidatus Bathyarchaeota archaeon]